MIKKAFFLFIPASIALYYLGASPVLVFLTAALAIIPLADLMREGAGQLSTHLGTALGGLLTVTFSNATELILSILLLSNGVSSALVKATIAGSIISNSLLGLGLATVIGVRTKEPAKFSKDKAGHLTSMLLLSVIALILPAVFDYTEHHVRQIAHRGNVDEQLSLAVSVVLILAYALNVIHSLITHRDPVDGAEATADDDSWPVWRSLLTLLIATAAVAYESEIVSHSVEAAADSIGLTKFFIGVIVLPLIGNAAEYLIAIHFAKKQRMDLTMSVAIGSSIQVALLTAPLLVLISYAIGYPMDLVFTNPLELFAIVSVAFCVNSIAQDGEISWFEGVLLLSVYLLLAVSCFYLT